MSGLTRDTQPVSRDQILRLRRGQGENIFSYSADHARRIGNNHTYPVDGIHSAESAEYIALHAYIHE